MKFCLTSYSIREFISLFEEKRLNLNPPYQRNPIWSKKSQQALISSILNNWPLPTIFLQQKSDSKYEVVDGQQRLRAMIEFHASRLSDLDENLINKALIEENNIRDKFYNYHVPVAVIEELNEHDRIEEFYALVNKTGLRLNRLELKKAEYNSTEFLSLLQELTDENSTFSKLGIFTKAARDRMNDLDFVSELLALLKFGVSEKKDKVDELFKRDVTLDEAKSLRDSFYSVVDILTQLETVAPIKLSRLRQKNDLYTFFGILHELKDKMEYATIELAYNGLRTISHLIRPSQEDCDTLQIYATHCVTQSNSKAARDERKRIIKALFFHQDSEPSKEQIDVLNYYKTDSSSLKKTREKWLSLNYSKLHDPR